MAWLTKLQVRIHQAIIGAGFPRDWYLIPLAAIIGCFAGLAAQGYGQLVRFSEQTFYGNTSGSDLGGRHIWLLLVLPMAGGLLVGLIKWVFTLPMISHGIPEVIESVARRRGVLRLRQGFFTALNSAITLGSGGAVGQEGPIVHIGSVVGSAVGQRLHMNREHMGTLIGCGAAAGLAAIFNAPIAGVLLVLEVLLRDFSLRTFMPVVVAAVFGTAVNQAIAQEYGAIFFLPTHAIKYHFTLAEVPPYLILGALCGLMGWAFTRWLMFMEHLWTRAAFPKPIRPALGGAVLGIMGMAFVVAFPGAVPEYKPPAFFGNGYPVVELLLNPSTYEQLGHNVSVWVALLFITTAMLGKTLGIGFSLGSGGSGGTFAPSLFVGASLGGAFGVLVVQTGWFHGNVPATYALAGMAGVLSAAMHCPLTAMLLVFEITQDYTVILPVMLTAIAGTIISQVLMRDSIYTMELRQRGIRMGTMSDMTILRRLDVGQVPLTPAVQVNPGDPVQRLIELSGKYTTSVFVVTDISGRYGGMVTESDVHATLLQQDAVPLMIVAEIMRTDLPTAHKEETLDLVLDKFSEHDVSCLAVVDDQKKVLGIITRSRLMRQYQQALEEH